MSEIIGYEFESFLVDTVHRTVSLKGELIQLRPTPFKLLLVFLENRGEVLSKEQLFKKVWANAVVTDANLDVALSAVRRALGERATAPRHIIKNRDGYRFVAGVREIRNSSAGISEIEPTINAESAAIDPPTETEATATTGDLSVLPGRWHVVVSTVLYSLLFSIALLLEVSYKWDLFGRTALWLTLPVFVWMMIWSIAGLKLDQSLTVKGKSGGLTVSMLCFLTSAAMLLIALSFFLPATPITESTLQTYPAQAAYLKDMAYFLLLAFFFLLLPFHFIVTAQRQIAIGQGHEMFGLLTGNKLSVVPKGTVYPRFVALCVVLSGFGVIAIALTSHLFDHLSYSPYMNLFTQLLYARGLVYFALGIECLIWYYVALEELKRQSL